MPRKFTPVQTEILAHLRRDPAAFLAVLPPSRASLWSGRHYVRGVTTAALARFLCLGLLREDKIRKPFSAVYVLDEKLIEGNNDFEREISPDRC